MVEWRLSTLEMIVFGVAAVKHQAAITAGPCPVLLTEPGDPV